MNRIVSFCITTKKQHNPAMSNVNKQNKLDKRQLRPGINQSSH